jgi:hypothetical protein
MLDGGDALGATGGADAGAFASLIVVPGGVWDTTLPRSFGAIADASGRCGTDLLPCVCSSASGGIDVDAGIPPLAPGAGAALGTAASFLAAGSNPAMAAAADAAAHMFGLARGPVARALERNLHCADSAGADALCGGLIGSRRTWSNVAMDGAGGILTGMCIESGSVALATLGQPEFMPVTGRWVGDIPL